MTGLDMRRVQILSIESGDLCERARFTGYTLDGGYAEFTVADARFCFRIPDAYGDVAAAPLLCAGLIGYRSLRKTGDAHRIGIYGFGAAAHIVAKVAHHHSAHGKRESLRRHVSRPREGEQLSSLIGRADRTSWLPKNSRRQLFSRRSARLCPRRYAA